MTEKNQDVQWFAERGLKYGSFIIREGMETVELRNGLRLPQLGCTCSRCTCIGLYSAVVTGTVSSCLGFLSN